MTVVVQRTLEKMLPDGRIMVAHARMEQLDGNPGPYFSLTGEEWRNARQRGRWNAEPERSGAMGDTLAEIWPELGLINRLHLSWEDGTPVHALENGWYFYCGDAHEYERRSRFYGEPTDTPHARAARYLRVAEEELPGGLDRDGFTAFVETLRPRWAAEAAEARAWLEGE